jgi:hypothetical protein
MSRPNITDDIIDGLDFARACVLDQRNASHKRKDHSWDKRYEKALEALAFITRAHAKAQKAQKASQEQVQASLEAARQLSNSAMKRQQRMLITKAKKL